MGQPEQRLPFVPAGQAQQAVGTDQPGQRPAGAQFTAQLAQGVDGVGRAARETQRPVQLAMIQQQAGFIADGQREHGEALVSGCTRHRAMRRISRWQHAYSDLQFVTGSTRDGEVPEVHRIEGAP